MNGRVLRVIRPKKKKKWGKMSIIDVETTAKNKIEARPEHFRFAVILDDDGTVRRFSDYNELCAFLTSTTRKGKHYLDGRTFWAHYGSGFDYLLLFPDMLTDERWEVIMSGSKIVKASFKLHSNNFVHFCDSFNLLPVPVSDLGEAVGLPKLSMNYKNDGPPTEEEWQYCIRDCEIVMKALLRMRELCAVLRPTIASQALSVYCRKYLPCNIYINELDNTFEESYFGGRVEAYYVGKCADFCYDINSLYPFVMKTGRYPHPASFVKRTNVTLSKFKEILMKYEGNAVLKVEVKSCDKPILPVKHDGKLVFPIGRLRGRWNFPEIRLALNHNQIEIVEIEEVVYSTRSLSPFDAYVVDLYNMRMNSKNEADKLIFKLLLNSLYGKFAQKYRDETKYVRSKAELDKAREKYGAAIKRVELMKDDLIAIHITSEEVFARHDVVSWASYVTSYARIYNWQLQYQIENQYRIPVHYTDTDSFFVGQQLPDASLIGKELGKLKLEKKKITHIFAPKDYEYVNEKGEVKRKLKGVPKNATQIDETTYEYYKIVKFKEGIRRGIQPGTAIKIVKNLNRKNDKRIVLDDGKTKPIELRMF